MEISPKYIWINIYYKLGARTLGARSRGSKNVTYIQQTTDKKVNTEEKSQKYGVIL